MDKFRKSGETPTIVVGCILLAIEDEGRGFVGYHAGCGQNGLGGTHAGFSYTSSSF
jgi:hypothetical protein